MNATGGVTIFLLLRAFAAGAVALTGTEAIATGVPAFQPPEPKNAAKTLAVMAGVLAILFIGITFLATNFAVFPTPPSKTVIAQVAEIVFGNSILFYLFQAFTALLLFLAANTSFAAFPRLGAVLAEDGFFPRQFALRGDRLAFSMGILLLGADRGLAGHRGRRPRPTPLIPLYAVGVFIDFTISQAGMIRHWLRERPPGWRGRLAINAIGCVATGVVADRRDRVKFARRRLVRPAPDPDPRQPDAVHPARVRRAGARAPRPRRPRRRPATPRAAGRRPDQRHQPGGHPGREVRADR